MSSTHEQMRAETETPEALISLAIYRRFQRAHSIEMSEGQFVGLCAYLCAILLWGYPIKEVDLDSFIVSYPTYYSLLPSLEAQQLSTTTLQIPSYHQWLRQEDGRSAPVLNGPPVASTEDDPPIILTAAILREIWKQHPYTFLYTEESMEAISKKSRDHSFLAQLEHDVMELTTDR